MTYIVTKYIKGNPYLYEVRSERDGDRVRQVFVRYLGRADKGERIERQPTVREKPTRIITEVTPSAEKERIRDAAELAQLEKARLKLEAEKIEAPPVGEPEVTPSDDREKVRDEAELAQLEKAKREVEEVEPTPVVEPEKPELDIIPDIVVEPVGDIIPEDIVPDVGDIIPEDVVPDVGDIIPEDVVPDVGDIIPEPVMEKPSVELIPEVELEVAIEKPEEVPEEFEHTVIGRMPSGEANLMQTPEGEIIERIATGKDKGKWKIIVGTTEYVGKTPQSVLTIARSKEVIPKALPVAPAVEAKPEVIVIPEGFETVYRGEGATSKKGGSYWSPSPDWAMQFTQTGQPEEVKEVQIKKSAIYEPTDLPYAGDPDAIDDAIKVAREKGYKAIRLSEGGNEPNSVYVFEKSALKSQKPYTETEQELESEIEPEVVEVEKVEPIPQAPVTPAVEAVPEVTPEVTPTALESMSRKELQRHAESPLREGREVYIDELKRRVLESVHITPDETSKMTKAEFIEQNADLVVKEKGRFGIIYYGLKTRIGDYQKVWQITSDSPEGVLEQLYDRLIQQIKPLAVEAIPKSEAVTPEVKLPEGYLVRGSTGGAFASIGGTWATDSLAVAKGYGEELRFMPKPINPLYMTYDDMWRKYFPDRNRKDILTKGEFQYLKRQLQAEGYDAWAIPALEVKLGKVIGEYKSAKDYWIFEQPKLLKLEEITIPKAPITPEVETEPSIKEVQ